MKHDVVRLERLKICNVKNILEGEIFFSEQKKLLRGELDENLDFASVLGIYGQNGSGKTSVLNALRIIQILFSRNSLGNRISDYVNVDKDYFSLEADFLVSNDNGDFYVMYEIEIGKTKKDGTIINQLEINKEKLSYFKFDENKKKINAFSYERPERINTAFLEKLPQKERVIYQYTCSIETSTSTNNGALLSAIFNPKLSNIVLNNKELFGDYADIVFDLVNFAISGLAIYTINYFNENENVGIRFRVKNDDDVNNVVGDMFVPFTPSSLPIKAFAIFKSIIKKVNRVMPNIIPGYSVSIIETNKREVQQLTGFVEFVLMSKRSDGGKEIPLVYESNGIKKIISILSGLIDAYSHEGCLMAIDEIDSGIFEYLLGEIVYVFDSFGFGQLLFTSHNMRVLEKINYKNIFFTTTDKTNTFIQLSQIRESNNLRDMYYKYIANGYKNDMKLYDMVKTEELANSMYIDTFGDK